MSIFSDIREIYTSQTTGMTRWECSNALTRLVLAYLDGDLSNVTGGKLDSQGRLRFSSGGGYDHISVDLLGGTADGKARAEFDKFLAARGI